MVHISGFGQTGPLAGQAGFGSVGEAMGGIRFTTGSPDRPPARAGISLGDALASVFGVVGTLSALVAARADRPGPGGRRGDLRGGRRADGVDDGRLRARRRRAVAVGQRAPRRRAVERVPDVATAPRSSSPPTPTPSSRRLCTAMGRPELATDDALRAPTAPAATNMDELDDLVAAWTATLPCDEVLARARRPRRAGRPHLHRARHARATRSTWRASMVQRVTSAQGWDVPMTGVVPRFTETPGRDPPRRGTPRRAHRRGARASCSG